MSPDKDAGGQLRRVTVRFGETAHGIVTKAAESEGVTFAQYVREAALMRAAYEYGIRREPGVEEALSTGLEMIRARWQALGGPFIDEG